MPCDILLIQPPIRDFYLTRKRTVPYGLASIAAVCRERGYRVALLDALASGKSKPAPLHPDLSYLTDIYGEADASPFALFQHYRHFGYALTTIAAKACEVGARIVGISSLFSAYEDMALACAQVVKEKCPDAYIVMGGHHPTVLPERVLDHPAVDFVLRGDGEASLPALAEALFHNNDLQSVPGIAYRQKNGRRFIRQPAYLENLGCLPPPAVDLIKERYYARKGKPTLTIATSRGCPMRCSYCSVGSHSKIPYRRRTVEHVMQEIAHTAGKREIGLIDFEDENIALDRDWFTQLLHHIIDYFGPRRPELRAMNGLFPPALDKNIIGLMQKAGFRELNLSLGTTDHRQSRRFNRPAVTVAFDRALKWVEHFGMTAVGYLIAGAPGQDPMTSVQDLLFLASRRVLAGLSVYYPAPASPDFATCRVLGLLPASPLAWRSTALSINHTSRRSENLTLLRLSRLLNFMKQCIDVHGDRSLPTPSPYDGRRLSETREEIGLLLLRWFLNDGIIRGVTRDGEVFTHSTCAELIRVFREGVQSLPLRGVQY